MSDKLVFVDSNVILYLFTDDERKKKVAESLLNSGNLISTQVVGENVNVCLRKLIINRYQNY